MKTTKLFIAFGLVTLVLAACNNDDDTSTGGSQPEQVDIRTTICATGDITADISTHATIAFDGSGNFDDEEELGIYAYVGTTPKLSNSNYYVNKTKLFWGDLSKTDAVTFAAYYPKRAHIANPEACMFNVANAANPDLLVAIPVTQSRKGGAVVLDFRHAMHRLVLNLTTNEPGWDVTQAKITLLNMNAATSVNILANVITVGEASEEDGDYAPQTGATATFILPPQKVVTRADWVKIEISGETLIFRVPAQYTKTDGGTGNLLQLNSGETLTLNLSVNPSKVTLQSGSIVTWNIQETIEDIINVGEDLTTVTSKQVKTTPNGVEIDSNAMVVTAF